MTTFFRRLHHLLFRARHDAELREEIEAHRALRQAALQRDGRQAEAASLDSLKAMGNVTLSIEDAREVWVIRTAGEVWQDVRLAFRGLWTHPSFAFAAVGTLALGIGANTAMFGAAYTALARPLPYADPAELVAVSMYVPSLQERFPNLAVRPSDFEQLRRSTRTFAAMAAIRDRNFTLTGNGEPERLYGARVSANLFALLGVHPALGRGFLPEEDAPGHEGVVVISHRLWSTRFGSNPEVVNSTISLDGQPHVVVGVMPQGFLFPTGKQINPQVELGPHIDVWRPAAFEPDELHDELVGFSWGVIGRLRPGASRKQAQAELDGVTRGIGERMRDRMRNLENFELHTLLTPLREVYFGRTVHQGLMVLMGAVGLLLIIGGVNLVNLLLARATSRAREFATRAALGAHRGRLVRQLLTESLVVALLGGLAGLPLAALSTRVLLWLGSSESAAFQASGLNMLVVAFSVATSLLAGLAVGTIPAIQVVRDRLYAATPDNARGTTSGPRTGRVNRALIMSEVALCTALLVVAGLLVRSFDSLLRVERGFEVDRVLSLDLVLGADRYRGDARVVFYRTLLDDLRALPGVSSAGAISVLPLTSESEGNTFLIYFDSDTEPRLDRPIAFSRTVTPGYFAAMGISLASGRFLAEDEPGSNVLISDGLARRLWPAAPLASIVGRRIKINEVTDVPATVVGVVGDVRAARLDSEPTPAVYVPYTRTQPRAMTLAIRTDGDALAVVSAVRAQIRRRDPSVPVQRLMTMRAVMAESMAPRRFQTAVVLVFALCALGLAIVGVYGVTNYAVARQTREIGVRFALGAGRSDLLRAILWRHLRPVLAGLVLGLLLGWMAITVMRGMLFGVHPWDPVALTAACLALTGTAALACYIPARRASRIDPMIALRHD